MADKPLSFLFIHPNTTSNGQLTTVTPDDYDLTVNGNIKAPLFLV
jgi:hypothetical protein